MYFFVSRACSPAASTYIPQNELLTQRAKPASVSNNMLCVKDWMGVRLLSSSTRCCISYGSIVFSVDIRGSITAGVLSLGAVLLTTMSTASWPAEATKVWGTQMETDFISGVATTTNQVGRILLTLFFSLVDGTGAVTSSGKANVSAFQSSLAPITCPILFLIISIHVGTKIEQNQCFHRESFIPYRQFETDILKEFLNPWGRGTSSSVDSEFVGARIYYTREKTDSSWRIQSNLQNVYGI